MIVTSNARGEVVIVLVRYEAAAFNNVTAGFVNAVDARAKDDFTMECTTESEAYKLALQYGEAMDWVYEDELIREGSRGER